MRNLFLYIGLLISFQIYAQEFGQQFFTIGEESLQKSMLIENSKFIQQFGLIEFNSKSIGINEDNYWNAVSMSDVYAKEEAYLNRRKNTNQKVITSET
ncbi:MAG TPA: hypothetical protein VKZ42_05060, partial [Flavobacteriaceae bacterium]|nr:hypothetical protein [Flavobacteriaceae bacterium]